MRGEEDSGGARVLGVELFALSPFDSTLLAWGSVGVTPLQCPKSGDLGIVGKEKPHPS